MDSEVDETISNEGSIQAQNTREHSITLLEEINEEKNSRNVEKTKHELSH